jgi:hypothetical protein
MAQDKKVLYISSHNRSAGTNEDFTITKTLTEFNGLPKKVKLLSASIPYTWDNVTVRNNQFTVVIGGVPTAISIPIGNYTGIDLAAIIQSTLIAAGFVGWTCSFSNQSLKFTITGTVNFQLKFDVANSAYILLGFNSVPLYPLAPAISVISPNYAVLVKDPDICVCSDLVEGSDNGVIFYGPSSAANYNILATVPVYTKYPTILVHTTSSDVPYYTCSQSKFATPTSQLQTTTRTMRFWLRFLSGEPVNLKNYEWSINIIFDFN